MNGNKLILALGFAGIVGSMHATPTFNPALSGVLYGDGKFNPKLEVAITRENGKYVDTPVNTLANVVLPSKDEVLNKFAQATIAEKTLAEVSVPVYGRVEFTTHHACSVAIKAALTAIEVNAKKAELSSGAFLMETLSRTCIELAKDFGVAELRARLLDARLKHLAHKIPGVNALKAHPYFDILVAQPANRMVEFGVRNFGARLFAGAQGFAKSKSSVKSKSQRSSLDPEGYGGTDVQ